jgi:hypothetical protein
LRRLDLVDAGLRAVACLLADKDGPQTTNNKQQNNKTTKQQKQQNNKTTKQQNNKQQTTNNKQQTTNNKQQTTKQQTTNNKQQTTNNKHTTVQSSQSGKYFHPFELIERIEPFEHQPPKHQKPLPPRDYPTIPYICPKNKITCNNLYHISVY